MRKGKSNTIQFIILMVFSAAILVQGLTHFIPMQLSGYSEETQPVELSFKTYSDGSYQDFLSEFAKSDGGFRELFIRSYNQYLYSCFKEFSNENVLSGEHDELYLKMYLDEISGEKLQETFGSMDDFKAAAQRNIEKTLVLVDSLRRHGTELLIIEAPSKTHVYPELMPKRYREAYESEPFSIQDYYVGLYKENHINHIDFLSYFKSIKDEFPYPLYSLYGTHWAESTIPFVADSILRKIEEILDVELPHIEIVDQNITSAYSKQDGELEKLTNLIFPLPKPALPWPVFRLCDTVGKSKPNALVIGDSYLVQLHESCFVDCFNQLEYWKYNREVYDKNVVFKSNIVSYSDAYNVIENADIIIIITTAPYAYNYLFGFCGSVNDYFEDAGGKLMEMKIEGLIEYIKNTPEWYESIKKQAEEKNVPVEEMLRNNAIYTIKMERIKENEKQ